MSELYLSSMYEKKVSFRSAIKYSYIYIIERYISIFNLQNKAVHFGNKEKEMHDIAITKYR